MQGFEWLVDAAMVGMCATFAGRTSSVACICEYASVVGFCEILLEWWTMVRYSKLVLWLLCKSIILY